MTLTRYVTMSLGDLDAYHSRAHMALLAVMAHAPRPCEMMVVTDHPSRYRWFGDALRIEAVDKDRLRAWRGRDDYFWRVKIEVVRAARDAGPAHVVYFDSDTLPRVPLDGLVDALSKGSVFLHQREYDLSRRRRKGDRALWRQFSDKTFRGIDASRFPWMWNAGIIALGMDRACLADEELALCDELTSGGARHALTEQMCWSILLAHRGGLRDAASIFDHFWSNKEGYDESIHEQLVRIHIRGMDVQSAVEYVRSHPIHRPLSVRKRWWNPMFLGLAGMRR